MPVTPVSQDDLDVFLAAHPNWQVVDGSLRAVLTFHTFQESIDFINAVAKHAEDMQHHPSLLIDFNKVTVNLCTHDAGDQITTKDTAMARQIEGVLEGE